MVDENETPVAPVENTEGAPPVPDYPKQEHGAQVHLTGEARAAARGALHGDIVSNTHARDAAVGRNEAASGLEPDGSTPDGHMPPDTMDGSDQAVYTAPVDKPSED